MPSAAVERALAAVRPHPHRGDLIAAAAVPLALGVLMTEVRFDGVWGRGVLFVLALLATALVLGMGLLAPLEEPRPRAYQTVLLVAGLALLALTIVRLAQVLGEDSPFAASGTVTWMTTLFAAVAAVAAWQRRSPICALIEFVAGGIALLAFVQWVFDPRGPNTSRWLLLVLILVYAAAHVRLRDHWPRHAVHAVNAAGVAAIVLGASYLGGIDPNCQTNPLPAGCPTATSQGAPAIFGTNFHTSYMPIVAQGCVGEVSCEQGQTVLDPGTGLHVSAVCDVGNGVCRPGATKTVVDPSEVYLDPTKHYYISVLPGDAMDPGHQMSGAQIAPGQTTVSILVEPQEQPPSKVSVFVFEDDHPLNGEHDASGGLDVLAPNEPGLGGFNITIIDLVGMSGDPAGQLTYDEFGQPLSNSLAGTIDPVTKMDACPVTANPKTGFDGTQGANGITGVIPVCPKYEADGVTLSPLAGQAVVANMPPGRYGIIATPAADRIARGEEWLQTNTLDGGKDHEAFVKAGEPAYFQEFGPAGFHVSIGFANPKYIANEGSNSAGTGLCDASPTGGGLTCNEVVIGHVTDARMSHPADERLYSSGSFDAFGYTQCFASLGSPDGADFSFAKCDGDGNFTLTGVPAGDWRLTVFDQWNDTSWMASQPRSAWAAVPMRVCVMDRVPMARPAIWEISALMAGRTIFPPARSST